MADTAPRIARRRGDPSVGVPAAAGRRRRAAAAVAVCLITVLAACGDDDDAATPATSSTTATTSIATTTTTFLPATTTTTLALDDAATTARAWTSAIADGSDGPAIAITSQRSLDAVGGEDGFRGMDIELAEGWGAWGRTDDKTVVAIAIDPGAVLAVFHGEVSQEGPPEESWAALPVVATADGDRVEPFLDLGEVSMSPDNGAVIGPDESLVPTTPDGAHALFVIDDGDPMTLDELADHAPLAPALHALTVVVWNADGVMARAFLYTVSD